jgi:hypothetical protein
MKARLRKFRLLFSGMVVAMLACGCSSPSTPFDHVASDSFDSLPTLSGRAFRAEPYIAVAIQLQAMGEAGAVDRLIEFARKDPKSLQVCEKVEGLCQMLFTPPPAEKHAAVGFFMGYWLPITNHLTETGWEMAPLEVVDGVPFSIELRIGYEGFFPNDIIESHVLYCARRYRWGAPQISVKTKEEREAALAKLIATPQWTRPLTPEEISALHRQIE